MSYVDFRSGSLVGSKVVMTRDSPLMIFSTRQIRAHAILDEATAIIARSGLYCGTLIAAMSNIWARPIPSRAKLRTCTDRPSRFCKSRCK